MDPNAAIREILRRLRDKDEDEREELVWLLQGLADWLDKGGFFPTLPEDEESAEKDAKMSGGS